MKIKIPSRVTLNLNAFAQADLLLATLNFLDKLIIFSLPFFVLLSLSENARLRIWLIWALVLFISKVFRFLFYGSLALPPVKFDLPLLTMITSLLLITIFFHQGDQSYANLGGANIWGIGMIMLFGLTLYLAVVTRGNSDSIGYLHTAIVLGIIAYLMLLINRTDDLSSILGLSLFSLREFVLAFLAIVLSWVGLVSTTDKFARAVNLSALFLGLAIMLLSMNITIFPFAFLLFLFLGIFMFIYIDFPKIRKQGLNPKELLQGKYPGITNVFLSLVTAAFIAAMYFVSSKYQADFKSMMEEIVEMYSDLPDFFENARDIFGGLGFSFARNSFIEFVISYGLLGVAVLVIFLGTLFANATKLAFTAEKKEKDADRKRKIGMAFLVSLLAIFALGLLINLDLIFVLIFTYLAAMIFSLNDSLYDVDSKEVNKRVDFSGMKKVKLFKKIGGGENWAKVATAVQLILAVGLLVSSYMVIKFVLELFGL